MNDIYLGTTYISLHKGKHNENTKMQALAKDIIKFKNKGGEIIIQGDLNTRTSNLKDFIEPDKYDFPVQENCSILLLLRNSYDKITDNRGSEILEICKSLDLCIIYGRKLGDMFGNVTSYQWNGCSIVDYAITSLSLFHKTLTFEIGKYQPWISDHCPLHYCLQIKNYSHVCPPNK